MVVICKFVVFCSITFRTIALLYMAVILSHQYLVSFAVPIPFRRVLNHCAAVSVRSLPTVFEGDAGNCLSAHLQASNITTHCSLLGEVLVVTVKT